MYTVVITWPSYNILMIAILSDINCIISLCPSIELVIYLFFFPLEGCEQVLLCIILALSQRHSVHVKYAPTAIIFCLTRNIHVNTHELPVSHSPGMHVFICPI